MKTPPLRQDHRPSAGEKHAFGAALGAAVTPDPASAGRLDRSSLGVQDKGRKSG